MKAKGTERIKKALLDAVSEKDLAKAERLIKEGKRKYTRKWPAQVKFLSCAPAKHRRGLNGYPR